MSNKWITEGIVRDLETGKEYKLEGTKFNEVGRFPEGSGLALKISESPQETAVSIQRVETHVIKGTDIAATSLALEAVLNKWEVIE